MDTKLIQQYGEDILCYRLRTARQKKRMRYKDFEKKLLKINREEKELETKQRNIEWVPLVPPFQRGWKRYFVLRADVAVSKQAWFFENILRKINTQDWSHRRDFKITKRRYGRKKQVVKGQQLLKPYDYQFSTMNFSEDQKQLFHEVFEYEIRGIKVKRYVFNEPWRFVLRVRPNMITMVKNNDAVIESRLKEISNYLERNKLREKLYKLLHGRNIQWQCTSAKHEYKEKYVYKNKSFSQVLYLINEENNSHGTATMEKIEWTTDPATPGT